GAIAFLEQLWGRDLTEYDPDGPLPDVDPGFDNADITRGPVRHVKDPRPVAPAWRDPAESKGLSIRELVIEVSARHSFVGTPSQVADTMNDYIQQRAADGFILVPHITPGGLDEFVDRVVPELQERGVYRDAYPGTTLRENLGLSAHRPEADWQAGRDAAAERDRAVLRQDPASAATRTHPAPAATRTHPALVAGSATRAVRFTPGAWAEPSA